MTHRCTLGAEAPSTKIVLAELAATNWISTTALSLTIISSFSLFEGSKDWHFQSEPMELNGRRVTDKAITPSRSKSVRKLKIPQLSFPLARVIQLCRQMQLSALEEPWSFLSNDDFSPLECNSLCSQWNLVTGHSKAPSLSPNQISLLKRCFIS